MLGPVAATPHTVAETTCARNGCGVERKAPILRSRVDWRRRKQLAHSGRLRPCCTDQQCKCGWSEHRYSRRVLSVGGPLWSFTILRMASSLGAMAGIDSAIDSWRVVSSESRGAG